MIRSKPNSEITRACNDESVNVETFIIFDKMYGFGLDTWIQ